MENLNEKIKIELLTTLNFLYLLIVSFSRLTYYILKFLFLYLEQNIPVWVENTKSLYTNFVQIFQYENFFNTETDDDEEELDIPEEYDESCAEEESCVDEEELDIPEEDETSADDEEESCVDEEELDIPEEDETCAEEKEPDDYHDDETISFT